MVFSPALPHTSLQSPSADDQCSSCSRAQALNSKHEFSQGSKLKLMNSWGKPNAIRATIYGWVHSQPFNGLSIGAGYWV